MSTTQDLRDQLARFAGGQGDEPLDVHRLLESVDADVARQRARRRTGWVAAAAVLVLAATGTVLANRPGDAGPAVPSPAGQSAGVNQTTSGESQTTPPVVSADQGLGEYQQGMARRVLELLPADGKRHTLDLSGLMRQPLLRPPAFAVASTCPMMTSAANGEMTMLVDGHETSAFCSTDGVPLPVSLQLIGNQDMKSVEVVTPEPGEVVGDTVGVALYAMIPWEDYPHNLAVTDTAPPWTTDPSAQVLDPTEVPPAADGTWQFQVDLAEDSTLHLWAKAQGRLSIDLDGQPLSPTLIDTGVLAWRDTWWVQWGDTPVTRLHLGPTHLRQSGIRVPESGRVTLTVTSDGIPAEDWSLALVKNDEAVTIGEDTLFPERIDRLERLTVAQVEPGQETVSVPLDGVPNDRIVYFAVCPFAPAATAFDDLPAVRVTLPNGVTGSYRCVPAPQSGAADGGGGFEDDPTPVDLLTLYPDPDKPGAESLDARSRVIWLGIYQAP